VLILFVFGWLLQLPWTGYWTRTACAMVVLPDFGFCLWIASMVAIATKARIRAVCQLLISRAATGTFCLFQRVAHLMFVAGSI
jgi:hypothetical protein